MRTGRRWRVGVDFYVGFTLGVTWAFDALWVNFGPMQVVIERAPSRLQ